MAKRSIALVILALLAMAACDDAPEEGRTTVYISSVNDGSPIQSDVEFNDGTSVYVTEDLVPVTFAARGYNKFITGSAHTQVVIENYHIVWTRTDGGTGNLVTRDETSHIYLDLGEPASAAIRLVTWADKSGPVLSPLVGGAGQIEMRADITFFGRIVGTEDEVETAISVSVHFADAVNTP